LVFFSFMYQAPKLAFAAMQPQNTLNWMLRQRLVSHTPPAATQPWNIIGNHRGQPLAECAVRFLVQFIQKSLEQRNT
jgi:hypothetical protein